MGNTPLVELVKEKLRTVQRAARTERSFWGTDIALCEPAGNRSIGRHENYFYFGLLESTAYALADQIGTL